MCLPVDPPTEEMTLERAVLSLVPSNEWVSQQEGNLTLGQLTPRSETPGSILWDHKRHLDKGSDKADGQKHGCRLRPQPVW